MLKKTKSKKYPPTSGRNGMAVQRRTLSKVAYRRASRRLRCVICRSEARNHRPQTSTQYGWPNGLSEGASDAEHSSD